MAAIRRAASAKKDSLVVLSSAVETSAGVGTPDGCARFHAVLKASRLARASCRGSSRSNRSMGGGWTTGALNWDKLAKVQTQQAREDSPTSVRRALEQRSWPVRMLVLLTPVHATLKIRSQPDTHEDNSNIAMGCAEYEVG